VIREPRTHREKHLAFVRGLPCVVCQNNIETEAAHVRMQCQRAGKRSVGKGEKPDDIWVVPLCGKHHRDQHHVGEREFWALAGIDPIFTALALWACTGNQERGEQIVMHAHDRAAA
jgi:hypothetical protein